MHTTWPNKGIDAATGQILSRDVLDEGSLQNVGEDGQKMVHEMIGNFTQIQYLLIQKWIQ